MAITRMQQPRQMYGLGSFVKKVTRKITRPVTKVAKKLVPKEIAGIMRIAAPFLPPGYREAAYLLGTAKQTGRISPVDLALVLAPQIGKMETSTGQTVSQRLGAIKVPFTGGEGETGKTLSEFLVGGKEFGEFGDVTPTKGIFGSGGEMFQFGKGSGLGAFRDQTKLGGMLLEGDPGKFSKSKLAGLGVGTLSLVTAAKTPEEAGENLVAQTGNSDDYERGVQLFSQLNSGVFDIPTLYRLPQPSGARVGIKSGGLMRENYALGTMPTAQESGLGGLPIEADMRYTGGFMPYGAKEKADDVPARLSKNEFVFTADAVRAAGGGSVQKGAQRMYNTMKQLESKPEAKGMTA